MKKYYKRCRTINESYTDIYLSIPGILTISILFVIGCVTILLKIADGNFRISEISINGIIGSLPFLLLCFLYIYSAFNVFITIRDNRKKNDNIILNGLQYECEIIGFQRIKYRICCC